MKNNLKLAYVVLLAAIPFVVAVGVKTKKSRPMPASLERVLDDGEAAK